MSDALQTYLDSVRNAPFQWGVHDCALFAAKAKGQRYVDVITDMRITSARAYRRLQRAGHTLRSLTCDMLGPELSGDTVVLARGDVVLVRNAGNDVLGIATPPVVLVPAASGLVPLPLAQVRAAWRIA